jgi:hypothetical protein
MNLRKFANALEIELNGKIKIEANKVLIFSVNSSAKEIKLVAKELGVKTKVKLIDSNKFKIILEKTSTKEKIEIVSAAQELGCRAFEEEQTLQDNPFSKNTKSFKDWETGFIKEKEFENGSN